MLIPPEIRKCVAFLAIKDETGVRLIGTAFFVGRPQAETASHTAFHIVHLVSARHVVEKGVNRSVDKIIYVRMNTKDGGSRWIGVAAERWRFHPDDDSVDVAAIAWAPSEGEYDYLFVSDEMAATDEIIEAQSIGIGDEVFLAGLFSSHFGKERNIPIVRVGNIAAMPEEKIETGIGNIDAYLVESRSIGGLSGSPVFVHLSGVRKGKLALGSEPIFWLGLMHGHWDARIRQDDTFEVDLFQHEKVNMGIAIVIPVLKIIETLDHKDFAETIEQDKNKFKKEK
ncbi:MAG: hypothetical protein QF511_04350 [Rhodospirillales bacterium]|nr:hypothetical protein [Rhodospirillales bacterium]MDP7097737.1 hypothetical protein [Rhodospirillales bacterium]HIJ43631.1 hypothetical protein [Rhodospirillaceae bacterium]HIJ93595.1 hypothetical protein [Rhodospirillaceae bacterium]